MYTQNFNNDNFVLSIELDNIYVLEEDGSSSNKKKILINSDSLNEYEARKYDEKLIEIEEIIKNLYNYVPSNVLEAYTKQIDQIFYLNKSKVNFQYCKNNSSYFNFYYAIFNLKHENIDPYYKDKNIFLFFITDENNKLYNDFKTITTNINQFEISHLFYNPCLFLSRNDLKFKHNIPLDSFPTGRLENKLSFERFKHFLEINFNNNSYFNQNVDENVNENYAFYSDLYYNIDAYFLKIKVTLNN